MLRVPALLLVGVIVSSCAPVPPSVPHSLLEQSIRWPALHRICGKDDKNCKNRRDDAFEVEQKPRLIEFWSPYCPPCRERLTELSRRHREFEVRGWSIVLVAVLEADESEAIAIDTLRGWGIFEPSWTLSQADSSKLGIYGLPSLWLVSARQRLRWVAPPRATIDDVLLAVDRIP